MGGSIFATYILMFCRMTIAVLFLVSFGRKLLAFRDFAITVGDFKLFPRRWSKTVAWLLLNGEIATAILVSLGGDLLLLGFLLAMVLLVVFSIALMTALWRNINMSCNCFGRTEQRISPYDVARNTFLALCSVLAWWVSRYPIESLSSGEIVLLALMSIVFLLCVTNLGDIVETLRRPFPVFEGRR